MTIAPAHAPAQTPAAAEMVAHGRALPDRPVSETERIAHLFAALDNFARVFDIRAGDRMVILSDRLLDPRVLAAIDGHARSRGVTPVTVSFPSTRQMAIPEEVKPILSGATFVVSTWFCSVFDPYCLELRRGGQRWVKITYFRDYDLLYTPQARFPVELVGEIVRATARRYREGNGPLEITDPRGGEFTFRATSAMTEKLLATNRWMGQLTASQPGAYVHYLPTHGPNLYERPALTHDDSIVMPIDGTVYPQWAVGFPRPFDEQIGVRFALDRVVEVTGESQDAAILREMLVGGRLIELGCGFNPKASRYTVYPAGSNSPGALHFGIDLAKPSEYIRRVMPEWEEPPVHMDLVAFDSTVRVGNVALVTDGFLEALRDAGVVASAARYGDPVDLLEGWPL